MESTLKNPTRRKLQAETESGSKASEAGRGNKTISVGQLLGSSSDSRAVSN